MLGRIPGLVSSSEQGRVGTTSHPPFVILLGIHAAKSPKGTSVRGGKADRERGSGTLRKHPEIPAYPTLREDVLLLWGELAFLCATCFHGLTNPPEPYFPGLLLKDSQKFVWKLDKKKTQQRRTKKNQVVRAPPTVGGSSHPHDKCKMNVFTVGDSFW